MRSGFIHKALDIMKRPKTAAEMIFFVVALLFLGGSGLLMILHGIGNLDSFDGWAIMVVGGTLFLPILAGLLRDDIFDD